VATAHLIQSDTLYALFVTAALWAVLRYARAPSLRPALLAGLFLGLSCLVRPAAQYLIFLLPLLLPLLALAGGVGRPLAERIGQGAAAAAIAAILIVPWMAHNAQAGKEFALSPPAMMLAYVQVHAGYLEKYDADVSLAEAHRRISVKRKAYMAYLGAEWEEMSEREREKVLIAYYIRVFFSYDLSVIVKATAYGWGQFFGAAGAANFHNLLGLDAPRAFAIMREKNFESHLGSVIYGLERSSPEVVAVSVTAFAFVIALRVLGLAGIVWVLMRRHYVVLLSCAGLIAYFAAFHMFIGSSRYRLPVEPALIFLALYGVDALRSRQRREG
jgi:4-amino-4-deoxy-L-arabinose transferase-like glycosyltransferase